MKTVSIIISISLEVSSLLCIVQNRSTKYNLSFFKSAVVGHELRPDVDTKLVPGDRGEIPRKQDRLQITISPEE